MEDRIKNDTNSDNWEDNWEHKILLYIVQLKTLTILNNYFFYLYIL